MVTELLGPTQREADKQTVRRHPQLVCQRHPNIDPLAAAEF
jgi:hypothetical protein